MKENEQLPEQLKVVYCKKQENFRILFVIIEGTEELLLCSNSMLS